MVDPPEAGELKLGSCLERAGRHYFICECVVSRTGKLRVPFVVGCTRFCVRHIIFPRVHQRAPLSPHLASTPHFCALPLIYHPCQGRATLPLPRADCGTR